MTARAAKRPAPIERRYALTSLGKGTSKYVLFSNDRHHAYVISRYGERPGDLYDGAGNEISGVFWRVSRIKPDSDLIAYEGSPGKSPIAGIPDLPALLDAAIDLDERVLIEVDTLLPTREAAIQSALRRYVARQHRLGQHEVWGVYDTVMPSWPSLIAGRKIADSTTDLDEAERDADWLNRHHA